MAGKAMRVAIQPQRSELGALDGEFRNAAGGHAELFYPGHLPSTPVRVAWYVSTRRHDRNRGEAIPCQTRPLPELMSRLADRWRKRCGDLDDGGHVGR